MCGFGNGDILADGSQLRAGAGRSRRGRVEGRAGVCARHRGRLQFRRHRPAPAGIRHRLAFPGFRVVGGGRCGEGHGGIRGDGAPAPQAGVCGRRRGGACGCGREAAHAGTGRRSDAVGCGVRHAVAGSLPRGRSAGRYALHQLLPGLRGAGAACVRARRFHGLPGCRRPDPGQRRRACGGTSRA